MKNAKRILILLLTLSVILPLFCVVASAAVEGKAGQNVTVTFPFESFGVSGEFTLSNPELFSTYKLSKTGDIGGAVNTETLRVYLYGSTKTAYNIVFTATLSANANPGDSCTITFVGDNATDADGHEEEVTFTQVVVVKAQEESSSDTSSSASSSESSSSSTSSESSSSSTSSESSSSSTSSGSTSKPETSKPGEIDYTELLRQIEIATGLVNDRYTDESWNAMLAALAEAEALTTSQSQEAVDAGAEKLKNAIAALVKIDYTKLLEAIGAADTYLSNGELAELWNKFIKALNIANDMLNSGDQAAIDKAAEDLLAALEALKKGMEEAGKTITVEVEVPVEPTDPFCNIPMHKVWPILFIVSAILNVVFIVLAILWFVRRKKDQNDDTPLVAYNIGDDD